MTDQDWDFNFAVNARGVFACIRAQINAIASGGSIVSFFLFPFLFQYFFVWWGKCQEGIICDNWYSKSWTDKILANRSRQQACLGKWVHRMLLAIAPVKLL